MIDQKKIHSQCFSYSSKKRIKALKELKDNFSLLPDKQQAWNDLIKLTTDENYSVRYWVTSALHFFSFLPIKQLHINLIKLINDEDNDVSYRAAEALGNVFFHVPDKQQAWNDLIKLTNDKSWSFMFENTYVSNASIMIEIGSAVISAFSNVPDKQKAWNDLIKLTNDKSWFIRIGNTSTLGSVFFDVPDKQKAWNDLIKLTKHEDDSVRSEATSAIGSAFPHVQDKQKAWNDLIKLTNHEDDSVRSEATSAIGSAFPHVQDKQKAWNDLYKLATDQDISVRSEAASAIGSACSYVPDKQKVWNDLIKLINDKYFDLRFEAASALGSIFFDVPNKQKVWNDLIKLTNYEDWNARFWAASALGSAFPDVPDKQQAWNDLIKLTNHEDYSVRSEASSALGSVFFDVPNKQKAWNDLNKLTNDEDSLVRSCANHSLGKISVFKASQTEKEEDYKKELEKAITFFEKAVQESNFYDPSQFCLPFYRSFHIIVFKKQESKEEVDKYLAKAKDAVRGSKSKELLFEAVNNLANALKEVQSLENMDFEAKKRELNSYRIYCDRAVELMKDTEETAPFATIAMRKGLPILDRNLKELLEEIQKKAKIACKESKGTDTEEIACTINSEIQRWEIGSQEEMAFNVENLIFTLEANTPHTPQNGFILDRIKQIPEQKDVAKQYGMLSSIITLIIKSSSEQKLQEIGEKVDQISDKLEEITISLKPGISEELIIHVGPITQWGGIEYTMSIPLQDISYPELKEDLQKIVGKKIDKLSKMPVGLANKVRDYLVQKKMWSILDKLT